jgi:hypothetical protein
MNRALVLLHRRHSLVIFRMWVVTTSQKQVGRLRDEHDAKLASSEQASQAAMVAAMAEHELAMSAQAAAHQERLHASSASETALAEAHERTALRLRSESEAKMASLTVQHAAAVADHGRTLSSLRDEHSSAGLQVLGLHMMGLNNIADIRFRGCIRWLVSRAMHAWVVFHARHATDANHAFQLDLSEKKREYDAIWIELTAESESLRGSRKQAEAMQLTCDYVQKKQEIDRRNLVNSQKAHYGHFIWRRLVRHKRRIFCDWVCQFYKRRSLHRTRLKTLPVLYRLRLQQTFKKFVWVLQTRIKFRAGKTQPAAMTSPIMDSVYRRALRPFKVIGEEHELFATVHDGGSGQSQQSASGFFNNMIHLFRSMPERQGGHPDLFVFLRWLSSSGERERVVRELYKSYEKTTSTAGKEGDPRGGTPLVAETVRSFFLKFDWDGDDQLDHKELPRMISLLGCDDEAQCNGISQELISHCDPTVMKSTNAVALHAAGKTKGLSIQTTRMLLLVEIQAYLVMQYLRSIELKQSAQSPRGKGRHLNWNVWM